jgi:6-phosphogluconolactonase
MTERLPDVIFVPDSDALAKVAADRILARLAGSDGILAVCLAGGSTPERLFQIQTTAPWRDAIPWNRIHWFWGDERFVPESDPRSNAGVARRLLLDHVPADHVFPVPTNAANETEAARSYEKELRQFYGTERLPAGRPLFDIVLLGVGSDGHTASLFPGHPQVDETERWVVGVSKAGLDPFVPRVTLTLPTLASTREMLFLVSGAGKRAILARVLAGEALPAAQAYASGWWTGRRRLRCPACRSGLPPSRGEGLRGRRSSRRSSS